MTLSSALAAAQPLTCSIISQKRCIESCNTTSQPDYAIILTTSLQSSSLTLYSTQYMKPSLGPSCSVLSLAFLSSRQKWWAQPHPLSSLASSWTQWQWKFAFPWTNLTTSRSYLMPGLPALPAHTGFMQFTLQVIPLSRAFLCSLYDFSTSFPSSLLIQRRISKPACCDLTWWRTFMADWNSICFISPSWPSVNIFTDASSKKGLGGHFGSEWFSA